MLLLFLFLLPRGLGANPPDTGEPGEIPDGVDVHVRAVLSQDRLIPGEPAQLAVTYRIPEGAHIQINEFFTVVPADSGEFTLGTPVLPPSGEFLEEPVYAGVTTVIYPITLVPDHPLGDTTLRLDVGYQACLEEPVFVCFAPEDIPVSIPVEVAPAGSKVEPQHAEIFSSESGPSGSGGAGGAGPKGLAGKLDQALREGSLLAFLLVFLGGIGTSFTPCVYPMIPITISYIGGRSRGKMGGLFLSIFFVLGIAVMYSALGVAAASTGALFGSAMQSTPVLLLVSAIFFLMGASMLGAFDIALPSGMQTRLQSGPRTGVIGAVLMGMVTGLVASPCVGPVLVVLLTFVANVGNLLYGFSLLFVFALGLGMLFIVIGTFAGALNALPAAGEWMETVKHVFGVILIGVGIYYVRRLLGPDLSLMAVGLFVLLIGTFFGAFRAVPDPAPHSLLLRKGLGIALVLCGGFILLVGTAGVTGVSLRPASPGSVESVAPAGEEAAPNWVTDDEAGLEMARREGKPVLIDFYADWCAACRELDRETWVDDQVRAETKRFVAIKMDFTKESDWSKAKKVDYDILGLPTVIFLDSKGNEVERFFGFRPPGQVLASLQKIR